MSWKSLPPKLSLVNNQISYFNNLFYRTSKGYETTTFQLTANDASMNILNVSQSTTLTGTVLIEGVATINGELILDDSDISGNIVTHNYISTGSQASGQFIDPNIGNGQISLCSSQENANFDNILQQMPQGLYFGSVDELNVPRIVLAYDSSGNVTGIEYDSCAYGSGSFNQNFYVQDGGVKHNAMTLNPDGSVFATNFECTNLQTGVVNSTTANHQSITAFNLTAYNDGIIGNFVTCGTNNVGANTHATLSGYLADVNFDGTTANIQPGLYFGDNTDFNVPRIVSVYDSSGNITGIEYNSCTTGDGSINQMFYVQDNGVKYNSMILNSDGSVFINDLQTGSINSTGANYNNIIANNLTVESDGTVGNFLTCGTNNSNPNLRLTLAGYLFGGNFDGTLENLQPGVYFGDDSDFNVPRITLAESDGVPNGINYICYSSQANDGYGHNFYTQDEEGTQRQALSINSLGVVNASEAVYANNGLYLTNALTLDGFSQIAAGFSGDTQIGINYYATPSSDTTSAHYFHCNDVNGQGTSLTTIDGNATVNIYGNFDLNYPPNFACYYGPNNNQNNSGMRLKYNTDGDNTILNFYTNTIEQTQANSFSFTKNVIGTGDVDLAVLDINGNWILNSDTSTIYTNQIVFGDLCNIVTTSDGNGNYIGTSYNASTQTSANKGAHYFMCEDDLNNQTFQFQINGEGYIGLFGNVDLLQPPEIKFFYGTNYSDTCGIQFLDESNDENTNLDFYITQSNPSNTNTFTFSKYNSGVRSELMSLDMNANLILNNGVVYSNEIVLKDSSNISAAPNSFGEIIGINYNAGTETSNTNSIHFFGCYDVSGNQVFRTDVDGAGFLAIRGLEFTPLLQFFNGKSPDVVYNSGIQLLNENDDGNTNMDFFITQQEQTDANTFTLSKYYNGVKTELMTLDMNGNLNASNSLSTIDCYLTNYIHFENTGSVGPGFNSSNQPVGINYYTGGPNNGYSYEHVFHVQDASGNSESIMSVNADNVIINNDLNLTNGDIFVTDSTTGLQAQVNTNTTNIANLQDEVNTNTTDISDLQSQISDKDSNAYVPLKGIVMYTGDGTELNKDYWVMCDGNVENGGAQINGITIPDLRGRFIVSSTYGNSVSLEGEAFTDYDLNQTGGEQQVTLTVEEIPAHSHGMDQAGNHSHQITNQWRMYEKEQGEWNAFGSDELPMESGGDSMPDQHTFNSGQAGNHSHTIQNTGGNGAHENRPAYYVLAFIIRIK